MRFSARHASVDLTVNAIEIAGFIRVHIHAHGNTARSLRNQRINERSSEVDARSEVARRDFRVRRGFRSARPNANHMKKGTERFITGISETGKTAGAVTR